MTAGELTFEHLGKQVTVSSQHPEWSVTGALMGVAHHCPNMPDVEDFQTVLTLGFDSLDSNLSTIIVSPSSTAVVG